MTPDMFIWIAVALFNVAAPTAFVAWRSRNRNRWARLTDDVGKSATAVLFVAVAFVVAAFMWEWVRA